MIRKASDFENTSTYPTVTIGTVEDVSDAHQMGRMKVRCRAWLDGDTAVKNLPNVRLSSSYFGYNTDSARGVNEDVSTGPIAYGQWNVPKVGSQVLVALIDNDQNQRVFLGSIPDLFLSHTLPHGRYLDDRIPRTSTEAPIEPLATNTAEAFSGDRDSAEYATRAMDRQVSAYAASEFGNRIVISEEADQQDQTLENPDGSTIDRTQGYVDGESAIYSTTTPGFHSMVMDDDPKNCRMRFRTTSGNQVIMDDTNERIYISTAKGKTWIEIDEKGTIDIYGEQDISISSDADLNLHAKENVRISGGTGVHVTSGKDIRMHSKEDISVKADGDLKTHAANAKTEIDVDMSVKVNGTQDIRAASMILASDGGYDLTVGADYKMVSSNYEFNGTEISAVGSIHSDANINAGIDVTALGNVTAGISVIGTVSVTGNIVFAATSISTTGASMSGGNISSSGIISSSADVVAGNTSLRSHVHMVPLPQHQSGMIPSALATPTAASIPPTPGTPATANPPQDPMAPVLTDSSASTADELPAYFPSRIPQHEPFVRSYIKKEETDKDATGESTLDLFDVVRNDIDSVLEYPSTDPQAGTGSASRGKDFARNSKWRR